MAGNNGSSSLYYIVRSPWAWVMGIVSKEIESIMPGVSTASEVSSLKELPSSTAQSDASSRSPVGSSSSPNRGRRSVLIKKPIQPCTLRLEIQQGNEGKLLVIHGTSAAFDGLEDKDELVRTLQRCRCEDLKISPPSILIGWDVRREECQNLVGKRLPSLNDDSSEKTVAVLKEPMGSRGEGIYFVHTSEEMYKIIEKHRKRALDEGNQFLDGIIQSKGRIPSWVLQAEVYPPMLIRGGRKFHIRTYVVAVEKLDHEDILDVYVYKRHEVRYASQSLDPKSSDDTTKRDRSAHITNGAMSDVNARILMSSVDELVDMKMAQRVERFVAEAFGVHFVPDMLRRVGAGARQDASSTGYVAKKFAMAGLDIMVDASGKLYLLEANVNPAAPPESTVEGEFKDHLVGFMKDTVSLLVRLNSDMATVSNSNSFVLTREILDNE